jgi:hypothetical protein
MQHISVPLSRAIADLAARAIPAPDRASLEGKPANAVPCACALCGSTDHNRSSCPWRGGLTTKEQF